MNESFASHQCDFCLKYILLNYEKLLKPVQKYVIMFSLLFLFYFCFFFLLHFACDESDWDWSDAVRIGDLSSASIPSSSHRRSLASFSAFFSLPLHLSFSHTPVSIATTTFACSAIIYSTFSIHFKYVSSASSIFSSICFWFVFNFCKKNKKNNIQIYLRWISAVYIQFYGRRLARLYKIVIPLIRIQ